MMWSIRDKFSDPFITKHRAVIMKLESFSRLSNPSMPFPRTAPKASALQTLCAEIDAALSVVEIGARAPFGQRVRAALQRAIADSSLLRPDQRIGSVQGYRRHLLAADPLGRYAIAALVWEPGQTSPVHGHRTWCAYAVIEGTLGETLYHWDDATQAATEVRRHPRAAGAVSYVDAGRSAIHQLGNPADAATRAISLHIYGVAGAEIGTHVNDLLAA